MRKVKNRNTLSAFAFLLPSLVGFLVFNIIPMLVSLLISFSNWDGLRELTLFNNPAEFFKNFGVGLSNYIKIFSGSELYQVLGNTLKFVVLYIPAMLLASFCVALILDRGRRGSGVFRVLYYIPVITSWVAGALIWKWALSPEYGIINNILAIFGIKGPSWLQSSTWAMPGIVLASIWKDMGYFGLMIFSGLRNIDRGYYEASQIDGASRIKQFIHISLPLLTPTMFFVLIISIINSFQIFPQVMVMTPDGGPSGSTMVMVERIYTHAFRYYEMGYASALSWILFIIIFLLTLVQMKQQERWVIYDT